MTEIRLNEQNTNIKLTIRQEKEDNWTIKFNTFDKLKFDVK